MLLLTEITPPAHYSSKEPVTLKADVSWLACKEQCVPGNAKVELNLPLTSTTPMHNTLTSEDFAQARALLPKY